MGMIGDTMKIVAHVALAVILGPAPVFAQSPTQVLGEPRFDVVSIRRASNRPADARFRPDGGVLLTGFPIGTLIRMAYPPQSGVSTVVGLPAGSSQARYDVIATASLSEVMPGDVAAMMRAMLADRFKLVIHVEKRELPAYDLLVARADGRLGPAITPIEADCEAKLVESRAVAQAAMVTGMPPPTPRSDPDLPPPPCMLRVVGDRQGKERLEGEGAMSSLVALLRVPSGRAVIDKTGLRGSYRMQMEFGLRESMLGPEVSATTDMSSGPTIFTAVREQLGLKLESSTAFGDVLVVDRLESPSEN